MLDLLSNMVGKLLKRKEQLSSIEKLRGHHSAHCKSSLLSHCKLLIDHFGEPLDSVYLDLQLVDRYSDGLEKRFYLSISARNIDIFVRNNWYFGVKYGGVF